MKPWASGTHFRLWLQGHNGRERQKIIDAAALRWFDPVKLGAFLMSQNKMQLDNLEIEMPRVPWYVEVWGTVVHWARLAWSIIEYGW